MSVKIANLKELSRSMPEIVRKEDNIISENINIKTEIKYLLISEVSNLEPENSNLFTYIFNGFAWETSSLIENLNRE